jgi:single-stranded-DNA-specific exonuclease
MKTLWKLKAPSPLAPDLARAAGLSSLEAQLLLNRGISEVKAVSSFLLPRLNQLADPLILEDMAEAVALILGALDNQEPITVYGDFDADGFTATALLQNFFSSLGVPVSYYIPDRLTEGYGLHAGALAKIAGRGPGLLITVDCGTTYQEEIALAGSLGLKVVVTDHHQVGKDFRPLCPVINPHRPDCPFPFKHLAGVGVAFFLAVALRAALREKGWFRHKQEPDLKNYLDLVALGTVADMVPLLDQNRILVTVGLGKIGQSQWPGVQALAQIADVNPAAVSSTDVAYRMAPRLNASGRMGQAEIGVLALTTGQPGEARELAKRLDAMNVERQLMERRIMEEIENAFLFPENIENRRTLVVAGRGWHRGVLGIVASRLLEKYHRPVLVLDIENGTASGSGRSIPGFNLYRALTRLAHLFERYGGHEHAAGLALKASRVGTLASELEDLAQKELKEEDLAHCIVVDAEIGLEDLGLHLTRRLMSLSPFGPGNPEPLFYSRSVEVVESRIVGDRHLKLKVRQGQTVFDAIGFGLGENHPLDGRLINILFTPQIDQWQRYEKVQLRLADLEPVDQPSKLVRDRNQ